MLTRDMQAMGLQSTSRIYKKSSRHGCTESQLEKLLCEFNAMKRSYFPLDGSGSACNVIPIRIACIMACYRELHVGQWDASRIALDLEVTVNTIFTKKEANEATLALFVTDYPSLLPSPLNLHSTQAEESEKAEQAEKLPAQDQVEEQESPDAIAEKNRNLQDELKTCREQLRIVTGGYTFEEWQKLRQAANMTINEKISNECNICFLDHGEHLENCPNWSMNKKRKMKK